MSDILLSIVVPTKNRIKYIKSFIDLYASFDKVCTELVIQDNSDTNNDLSLYIEKYSDRNIVYNYVQKSMPIIENSELAILNSRGRYVCFMGDDDLLSKHVVDVVHKMDEFNIDSILFKKAIYNWPGVVHKKHKFPSLIIPNFSGGIKLIEPQIEYEKLLQCGATRLEKTPQLYHGIIKRSVLDEIRKVTGKYFPGPSPDMAVAICLSCFASNHVYMDAPFISSGVSPKSAAGLGAKHEHKGDLKSMSFLPSDIDAKWDNRLPYVWTGPTIYAQSAIEAIKAMDKENDLEKFNYSFFYAYFDTFFHEYADISKQSRKNVKIRPFCYLFGRVSVFLKRAFVFIKNKLLLKFRCGGKLFENVLNCVDAQAIIDCEIEKVIDIKRISFCKDSRYNAKIRN